MLSTTPHIQISFLKKLASYIRPFSLRRGKSDDNAHLELFLFHGRLQLVTSDAIYSDGNKYIPATVALKDLKKILPGIKTALVLGGGLCSIVQVMHSKGFYPQFTIVEKDKVVLQWAMELLTADGHTGIEPVCNDARLFMERNIQTYDLLFIDIFNGRVVPGFVFTTTFLQQCKKALSAQGRLAFNYIINDNIEWAIVKNNFAATFPNYHIIDLGLNQILIS